MDTVEFVKESNKIESIFREPTSDEIFEHDRFVNLTVVTRLDLIHFVRIYQPNATIRNKHGLDVRVGSHVPPPGSKNMDNWLQDILDASDIKTAYELHIEYETLHPFTDGNGRSGRALWAWKMIQDVGHYDLGFLHHFYYQTLNNVRL